MWYAVETAFVDGKHFKSRPCFDMNVDPNTRRCPPGTCLCAHYEEPHNTCETFMEGLIEIHVDWFQTKEQAMKFIDGTLTYVMYYQSEYVPHIKTTLHHFIKWEAVDVTNDRPPFIGIYKTLPDKSEKGSAR